MSKKLFLIGLLMVLIVVTQSVFASGPKMGTAGAVELLIPMGARNVAMGGSNIATVSGTEAMYWNPAGLSMVQSGRVSFSYLDYFADMKVTHLAAGARAGATGVIGVSFQVLSIGEIAVTTVNNPEGTGEVLKPSFLTAGVTYSRRFTDRIAFGTNAKVISETIGMMSASAMAFDFGLQYVTPWGVAFGVTMKNIGTQIRFDGSGIEFDSPVPYADPNATTRKTRLDMASHELPVSMNMGLAYVYNLGGNMTLNLSGSYNNNAFELDNMLGGVELGIKDMLFVRAGYKSALYPEDWNWSKTAQYGLSMGFGLNLDFSGMKLEFDYANRPMDLFDANQYFSVSFGF